MDIRLKMALLILFFVILCYGLWKLCSSLGTYLSNQRRWKTGSRKAVASISGFLADKEEKSRNLVEEKLQNGLFRAIPETVDRSVHYFVFPQLKKRSRLILEWNNGKNCYRAFYPYPRETWSQNVGDTVEVHYNEKKPWIYAIADPGLTKEITRGGLLGSLLILIACAGLMLLF